jgi:hypothetical protein
LGFYTNSTVPTTEDGVATVKAADRPDKKHSSAENRRKELAKPLVRQGVDATLKSGQTWRTEIQFDPVHAASEDGAGVECTVLGPDHPCGSKPDSSNIRVCPNRHALDSFGDYRKGHLLNETLGGPGTDTRNLTAIPAKTNAAMSTGMEDTLKALVNEQRAWIYYRAKVTHAQSSNTAKWYAKKISCQWWELKADGTGQPVQVPSTKGTAVFDIPDPVEYQSDKKGAAGFGVTIANKTGAADKKDDATAEAAVAWNSIVLRNWDYVKKLKDALGVAEPMVAELKQTTETSAAEKVGAELVDAIATPPSPAEEGGFTWLETHLKALEADKSLAPDKDLRARLHEYATERKKRIAGVLTVTEGLLKTHVPTSATSYLDKIQKLLVKSDPLAVYSGLIEQCLRRLDALVKEKQELEKDKASLTTERDKLKQEKEAVTKERDEMEVRDAEHRAGSMSPKSVYDLDAEIHPEQHKQDKPGSRKRVKDAAKDTSDSRKNQRLILGKKPTQSAEVLSKALHAIRRALDNKSLDRLPAAFTKLNDAAPTLHFSVNWYLTDPSGVADDFVSSMIHGFAAQEKTEDQFMAYLVGMKEIPEFATAFSSAGGQQ